MWNGIVEARHPQNNSMEEGGALDYLGFCGSEGERRGVTWAWREGDDSRAGDVCEELEM